MIEDEDAVLAKLDEMRDTDPSMSRGDYEMVKAAITGKGLTELTPDMLTELVDAAGRTADRASAMVAEMTVEQAEFVRKLRVDDDYSWRAVAEVCHLEWGGVWSPPSNQIYGMEICQRAASFFGEHYLDEAWNGPTDDE